MLIFAVFEPIIPGIEHCALKKWAAGVSIFFLLTREFKKIYFAGFELLTPGTEHCALTK